jgi:hypothetical protein
MKSLISIIVLTITAGLVITACNGDKQANKLEQEQVKELEPMSETVLPLPANWMDLDPTMLYDGNTVEVQAYLWRDFMPGPDRAPEEMGLNGVIKLHAVDTMQIRGDLSIFYVWLVHGNQYWGQSLRAQQSRPGPDYEVEYVIGAGPRWDVGEPVDVIVEVVDLHGNSDDLRLGMQVIQATH